MPPTDLAPVFNVGAIGCVLAWFMFKAEPRLRGIEDAIDRNSKAMMLFIMAQEQVAAAVKSQAQGVLEEITQAEAARRTP